MVWRPGRILVPRQSSRTKPMRQPCRGRLLEAIAALRESACFRAAFGDAFVDYFVQLKEFEIGRFLSDVTDWEQREYFELL